MIIRAIRLKNIKSYGEGPEGDGVTVRFQPGVNRIAGRNGHGKSTLIEALGYALFDAEPPCLENFDLTTYFLRAGSKAGEIDVTFSHGGETYRVERGLGAGKRRTKVVLVDDGSICAEDEAEVAAFLGRLLGFPGARRADMYLKLLGVKQGHLTRPFDSKPGQAKDFFEPLLEVEVFRQCFERIKPAVALFESEHVRQDRELAAVEERIRERQDSPVAVAGRQAEAAAQETRLRALDADLEALGALKARLEAQAARLAEAARQRDEAQRACALLAQARSQAQDQLEEAREAAQALERLAPGHRAWLQAEAELKRLRARQDQQRQLEDLRARTALRRTELDAKVQAALDRAGLFAGQRAARTDEAALLLAQGGALQARLERDADPHRAGQDAARCIEQSLAVLTPFSAGLGPALDRSGRLVGLLLGLEGELAAWDPAALAAARAQAQATGQRLQELTGELTGLRERQRNLDEQLREIGSGVCPFLKEQCRQFDPAKVQTDLGRLAETIGDRAGAAEAARDAAEKARSALDGLERRAAALDGKRAQLAERAGDCQEALAALVPAEVPAAGASLRQWAGAPAFPAWDPSGAPADRHQAGIRFRSQLDTWWRAAEAGARSALAGATQEAQARLRDQQDLAHLTAQRARLADEAGRLETAERSERASARELGLQAAAAAAELEGQGTGLAAFATLEGEIAAQVASQEANRADYQGFLGRKPAADQLEARQAALLHCQAQEQEAGALLAGRVECLAALQDFDPQALAQAGAAFLEQSGAAAACRAGLEHAREALRREREREAQWLEACAVRDARRAAMARIQAAGDLGELARTVLKNAAPAVAQHLCSAIAARAQGIFNLINPDPVELQWNSTRYSLRIIPGERRFAMLSGGEQTKLALAMTLAMIQEFSGLRFCIFDEPTYGVDADSRAKLADAILAARRAADLDQLLLVSHDDAFEGRVEHAILLTRSAAGGTRAALED